MFQKLEKSVPLHASMERSEEEDIGHPLEHTHTQTHSLIHSVSRHLTIVKKRSGGQSIF